MLEEALNNEQLAEDAEERERESVRAQEIAEARAREELLKKKLKQNSLRQRLQGGPGMVRSSNLLNCANVRGQLQ